MSGLSCAGMLSRYGYEVTLFDKGRGPGGRMASRRIDTVRGTAAFDFGAQYFTVRDPAFAQQVAEWQSAGVVTTWPQARPDAYVGTPTMNAILQHLCAQHDVVFSTLVKGLTRQGNRWQLLCEEHQAHRFDCVVLALPAEQTAPILTLHDFQLALSALYARSQPCWTGMFAFDAPVDHGEGIIRDAGLIAWAARNNAKPGRSGPESWVVQANPTWSTANLERQPDEIGPALLAALAEQSTKALPALIGHSVHRWRYGLSAGTGAAALWNSTLRIGACGDWLLGPRVECAWLSGRQLAEQMITATSQAAE